jgi:hypothetical protein
VIHPHEQQGADALEHFLDRLYGAEVPVKGNGTYDAGYTSAEVARVTGLSLARIGELTRAEFWVRDRYRFLDVLCLCLADAWLRVGLAPATIQPYLALIREHGITRFDSHPTTTLLWIPRHRQPGDPWGLVFTTIEHVNVIVRHPGADGMVLDLGALIMGLRAALARTEADPVRVQALIYHPEAGHV